MNYENLFAERIGGNQYGNNHHRMKTHQPQYNAALPQKPLNNKNNSNSHYRSQTQHKNKNNNNNGW